MFLFICYNFQKTPFRRRKKSFLERIRLVSFPLIHYLFHSFNVGQKKSCLESHRDLNCQFRSSYYTFLGSCCYEREKFPANLDSSDHSVQTADDSKKDYSIQLLWITKSGTTYQQTKRIFWRLAWLLVRRFTMVCC